MRYELHSHSHYSVGKKIVWEGLNSPKELVKAAKAKGLGGIAITDHNSIRSWAEAKEAAKKEGMVFIPGIEVSSSGGHIIGLGVNELIERDLGVNETIEKIREQGGIAIAPHPYDIKGEGVRDRFARADAVEVFNALNVDIIANNFTRMRVKNSGMPMTVGSDAHNIEMLGHAVNRIDASDTDSLIREIKLGNIGHEKRYIPVNMITFWAKKRMEKSQDYTTKYIKDHYCAPKALLAKYMLDKYVNSRRTLVWTVVGHVSVNVSRGYGVVKVLSYF